MTYTLDGQEVLYVIPLRSDGTLSPITAETTTGAIAALGGGGGGDVISVDNADGSLIVNPTTGNVIIGLHPSTVTAGNYTNANITVNANGIVTAASNGSGGGAITWNEVTITTQALAVANGYVMNNASQVVGTLPSTAIFGSIIRVAGKGAGGWKIAQNAGQTIHFDGNNTTTGTSGYLASQSTFDCVDLLCVTANTDFVVTSSIGNITGN